MIAFSLVCLGCMMAGNVYKSMIRDNNFDIDEYVHDPTPNASSCAKCVVANRLNVGRHVPSSTPLLLAERPSPFVPGLHVTSLLATGSTDTPVRLDGSTQSLVVGTIRMGFGHHRIAYAASSWGVASGCPTYFHDLLSIDSAEAQLIRDQDKMYSKASRMASELGGPVERIWGSLTKSGDENMLRVSYQMAEHLKPLLLGIPKDTPIIATHSFVGLTAVACGFTKVVNLVIDNHAQWFCIVPGALNLVQGPSNYHNFLRMGVPAKDLRLAGHWIPRDLVENIPSDCNTRKERARGGKATRILIPIGGAGAQRKFVISLVTALTERVKAGTVQLFLNAGDHAHMKIAFEDTLRRLDVAYSVVDSIEGVRLLCERLLAPEGAPDTGVTLFAFTDYFPAVATTDIFSRVADVLCCKPSELAFYPVPKLMIRRVGDHEYYSALRASEVGDGTLEVREVKDALAYVKLFESGELLEQLNDCIIKNNTIGIYSGCKNAIEAAFGRYF